MDRKQILDSLKAEMIDTLQKVLRFETVTTDALPGMPFGKNNADCLASVSYTHLTLPTKLEV